MRIRELLIWEASDLDLFWKLQMTLGAAIALLGLAVLLYPEILVVLVSSAITMVGIGLIYSGWKLRQLQRRIDQTSRFDVWQW